MSRYVGLIAIINVGLAACQSYNDQSTELYVTSPSCASYKCEVVQHHGDKLQVNWLNAPPGDVKLILASENNGNSYTIKERIAGTKPTVIMETLDTDHAANTPRLFPPTGPTENSETDSYTLCPEDSVQVISLSSPDKIGYTDIVTIKSRNMARSRIERAIL
ncbi:hypothetical protein PSHT_15001 [Puccinia striiformis]|uniref:Secreted protein n=1 Tax=Puccinia striiformis TaxID=27350 RepID=A0A2S4UHH1_9BASI|nr:hypothetical protein PSHT_15001 [Puccinia striiformis]